MEWRKVAETTPEGPRACWVYPLDSEPIDPWGPFRFALPNPPFKINRSRWLFVNPNKAIMTFEPMLDSDLWCYANPPALQKGIL